MQLLKLQTVLGLALVAACFGSAFAQSPSPAAALRPTGFLDVATETGVAGWACLPSQPFRPLILQVFVDNRLVGTTVANTLRRDVASSCGGIGFHGFNFTFPAGVQSTLQNGQPHTVQVFTIQTIEGIPRIQLNGSPKTVVFSNTAPRGFLDVANTTGASGWACDPNNFNTPLRVDIYIDNNVFAGSTTANLPREASVAQQCGGNGNHGWTFTFPANIQNILNNGQPHTVRAYAINIPNGNNPELSGSPKTVQTTRVPTPTPTVSSGPNTLPRGFLDLANATSAVGWACDPDNFNTPLRVDIYIDNNVFAGSTTANLPREAGVAQQCGGNANHGWTFTFPENIRNILSNGQPHTVRAYAINTPTGNNPELGGSPKTVQTAPSPSPSSGPNAAPIGFLDAATRTTASGWACDPDNFNTPLRVDIYVNNNVFAGSVTANLPREAGVGQQCGGNANHGWTFTFPANIQALLANGGTVQAYAINTPNGNNPQLGGSPKNV